MNLEGAERIIHRWIVTRRPGQKPPPLVRHAYTWTERKEQAKGPSTSRELFNLVSLARDEIMQRGLGYANRAGMRRDVADYIEKKIFPATLNRDFLKVAEKLRAARQTGTWGTRPNGDQVIIWDDKSNLLHLDPDEAREDAKRIAERYVPALLEKAKAGAGVHYGVFTMPNFSQGDLRKGMDAIQRRYQNMLRKTLGKKKLFPEIAGSISVIETPAAADGTWNVHLNVVFLTRSKFEAGLYKKIRRAWHWNVELQPIATEDRNGRPDPAGLDRAFRELIKYATRIVPDKSADKAASGRSRAPALTDWPAESFVEWSRAHKRFRRTRTYGELYNVPKPDPRTLDDVTWHGAVHCAPDRFFAQVPLIDLIPAYKLATDSTDNQATGPPRPWGAPGFVGRAANLSP